MQVLIIGCNHSLQLEDSDSEWKVFKNYLIELCNKEIPDIIAEELNQEAIKLWNSRASVAKNVANSLGIQHLFCDPDSNQRMALGIKDWSEIASDLGYGVVLTHQQTQEVHRLARIEWEKRENYWLNILVQHYFQKCIFITGSDHVKGFSKILLENRIHVEILLEKWGQT